MKKKFFGTDGIRGRVGKAPITAEFMLKLGWAFGKVFSTEGRSLILIGKDTRVSGYMFESALEAGLAAAGADVALLGPMPTPAIAYLTRTFNASAGIVISASHNGYHDNGVKFFSSGGVKLDDSLEEAIEKELGSAMHMVASDQIGKVSRINDAAGRYIEFCKSTFPSISNLRGFKVVLDCAHGATYHVAPNVLRELGASVIELGTSPDGYNINAEGGSTKPEQLRKRVLLEGADLGIALDGDGDRVVMVDDIGAVVDGDELLFIIADALHRKQGLEGGVVGTQMSNLGLEQALREKNISFVRAAVGDRHVLAELKKRKWRLGGESSGHLICLDKTTTGDGIISALQVLAAITEFGCSLRELKQGMTKYPQHMINVPGKLKREIRPQTVLATAVAKTEKYLGERGRVLLRASGTEPVVRVMVEGEDPDSVISLAENLAKVVSEELG